MDLKGKIKSLGLSQEEEQDFVTFSMEVSRYLIEYIIDMNFTNEEVEKIDIDGDKDGWNDDQKTEIIDNLLREKKGKGLFDYLDIFWEKFFEFTDKSMRFAAGIIQKVKDMEGTDDEKMKAVEEYIETYQDMKLREILNLNLFS